MASKNIKGITIEIGGNTTKLESALKNVNKVVYSTNSELKQLNQALKLDPKNTELLAQKQELLRKNIAATTERLNTLKEAQRQMGSYSSLTDEQKEQYRALSVEIAKGENALKGMNKELKASTSINLDGLKDALKKVGDVAVEVTKKMVQVSAAIGGALAGLVAAGVKSYAQFEQLEGGAKLLFGTGGKNVEEYAKSVGKSVNEVQAEYDKLKKAENTVMENSRNAYATMGLSSSQYLEQVNSYAVGLKSNLNGDSQAAAELANKIMVAQADIVAATGNTQEAVENAFRGVMRGNYTMLDNLQLGITPTKEGFQQVIDKVNEWNAAQGRATQYQMGNYADMEAALVDYVEMQGLAGYAANEAAGTITGSVASMKAAFDNFLNGSGSPEALANSITNVFKNIGDAITKLAPNILSGVVTLIKTLLPQVVKMLVEGLPQLMDAVSSLIDSLLEMVSDTTAISNTVTTLINKFVEFVTTNLPKIIEIGVMLLLALVKGISDSIGTLIPTLVQCIITMQQTLLQHLPELIICGIQLLIGIITGLVDAIPMLVDMLPMIIETTVNTLLDHLPEIIMAGWQLTIALIEGLIKAIPQLLMATPKLIIAVVKSIIEGVPKLIDSAKELIGGMISGFSQSHPRLKEGAKQLINKIKEVLSQLPSKAMTWAKDMITGFVNGIKSKLAAVGNAAKGIANKIKSFLHFSKPDEGPLRDYETWMPDFVEGLAKGIDKSSYMVENATANLADNMANALSIDSLASDVDAAMRGLNSKVSASVNPTVNPNVTYETNYKMMARAVKEALADMDIVLDDDRVGRFVTKTVADQIYT